MNILVLDCAVSKFSIGVKSEKGQIIHCYDMGMRQSELIVPTLQNALDQAEVSVKDIEYTAITIGPGSFTGLRLFLSSLKALTFAYNIPIYKVSTLSLYAWPLIKTNKTVISCIDANKEKFYATICKKDEILLKEDDYNQTDIIDFVNNSLENEFWILGPDNKKLQKVLSSACIKKEFFAPEVSFSTAESLLKITEELIEQKKETLKDFEGPNYLRASEAELKLNSN